MDGTLGGSLKEQRQVIDNCANPVLVHTRRALYEYTCLLVEISVTIYMYFALKILLYPSIHPSPAVPPLFR
jgi:hypothetical protein